MGPPGPIFSGVIMDGEELYNLWKEEMEKLDVGCDDFELLDAADQTAWHCVAVKLEKSQ